MSFSASSSNTVNPQPPSPSNPEATLDRTEYKKKETCVTIGSPAPKTTSPLTDKNGKVLSTLVLQNDGLEHQLKPTVSKTSTRETKPLIGEHQPKVKSEPAKAHWWSPATSFLSWLCKSCVSATKSGWNNFLSKCKRAPKKPTESGKPINKTASTAKKSLLTLTSKSEFYPQSAPRSMRLEDHSKYADLKKIMDGTMTDEELIASTVAKLEFGKESYALSPLVREQLLGSKACKKALEKAWSMLNTYETDMKQNEDCRLSEESYDFIEAMAALDLKLFEKFRDIV